MELIIVIFPAWLETISSPGCIVPVSGAFSLIDTISNCNEKLTVIFFNCFQQENR